MTLPEIRDYAMQQQLLFVTRRSPDWIGLASDFKQRRHIDPARFRPTASIPAFPEKIVELVDLWNSHMSIDFFSCRARLKQIADDTIAQLPGARRTSYDKVSSIGPEIEDYVVFFHDDDDWFSPNMVEMVSEASPGKYDICVFNLVALWINTVTFVRDGQTAPVIVGRQHDFTSRYQSNNYGINGRICDRATLMGMTDHILASDYANTRAFRDVYIEQIIGVTAKTPCSASMLPGIFSAPDQARERVQRYVDALTSLAIPVELGWIADRVGSLIQLFSTV